MVQERRERKGGGKLGSSIIHAPPSSSKLKDFCVGVGLPCFLGLARGLASASSRNTRQHSACCQTPHVVDQHVLYLVVPSLTQLYCLYLSLLFPLISNPNLAFDPLSLSRANSIIIISGAFSLSSMLIYFVIRMREHANVL